jgi:hypothetical protein
LYIFDLLFYAGESMGNQADWFGTSSLW